jgi:hypothetical protein
MEVNLKINILWESGIELKDSYEFNGISDFGIYQVYGAHPIYGHHVLLYIGRSRCQTFGGRFLSHEKWPLNQDSKNVKVYFGRLASDKGTDVTNTDWDNMIDIAEKLLIFSHQPACNSSNINNAGKEIPEEAHVLNWGDRGVLLPEVSARRFDTGDGYNLPSDLLEVIKDV